MDYDLLAQALLRHQPGLGVSGEKKKGKKSKKGKRDENATAVKIEKPEPSHPANMKTVKNEPTPRSQPNSHAKPPNSAPRPSSLQRLDTAAREEEEGERWAKANPCYLCAEFGHRAKAHKVVGGWPAEWETRWALTQSWWLTLRGFIKREETPISAGAKLGAKTDDLKPDMSVKFLWSIILMRVVNLPNWTDQSSVNRHIHTWPASSLPRFPPDDDAAPDTPSAPVPLPRHAVAARLQNGGEPIGTARLEPWKSEQVRAQPECVEPSDHGSGAINPDIGAARLPDRLARKKKKKGDSQAGLRTGANPHHFDDVPMGDPKFEFEVPAPIKVRKFSVKGRAGDTLTVPVARLDSRVTAIEGKLDTMDSSINRVDSKTSLVLSALANGLVALGLSAEQVEGCMQTAAIESGGSRPQLQGTPARQPNLQDSGEAMCTDDSPCVTQAGTAPIATDTTHDTQRVAVREAQSKDVQGHNYKGTQKGVEPTTPTSKRSLFTDDATVSPSLFASPSASNTNCISRVPVKDLWRVACSSNNSVPEELRGTRRVDAIHALSHGLPNGLFGAVLTEVVNDVKFDDDNRKSWTTKEVRSTGLREGCLAWKEGMAAIPLVGRAPISVTGDCVTWDISESHLFTSKEGADLRVETLNPPSRRHKSNVSLASGKSCTPLASSSSPLCSATATTADGLVPTLGKYDTLGDKGTTPSGLPSAAGPTAWVARDVPGPDSSAREEISNPVDAVPIPIPGRASPSASTPPSPPPPPDLNNQCRPDTELSDEDDSIL